ncbi:MAG: RloB domain-containing protein [Bacteroidales bacterium]|nr:RloB domain-containing protein [Bacteroidales bacterium]
MAKRKLGRSILIVCEGTKTEHDYFQYNALNISYSKGIWDRIDISDNETIPNDISLPSSTELGKRKKRPFINPNKRKIREQNVLMELCKYLYGDESGFEKYQTIKAVPLRYVAQAQLIEKEQELYEELWAVFDKNGHSHHKEAYVKANELVNNKKVQIGFTSRSFEHWILLHFEKNKSPFKSSECKNNKGIPLDCNSENGCKGLDCLSGYIRVNTPLKNYKKSNSSEDLLSMMNILLKPENLKRAFENAKWLREEIKNDPNLKSKKCYELNPYTDVDILVKKLIE